MTSVGKQLSTWRKAHSIKQEALAEMLGVSQAAISHWERGRDTPSSKAVEKLQSVMAVRQRDALAVEKACISQLHGLRALFDLDGIQLVARSQGFLKLWPELSNFYGRMLQDDLVEQSAELLNNADLFRGAVSGELLMVSGVSETHLSTPVDLGVRYKHHWQIMFRRFGHRTMIDMSYEPCAAHEVPRIDNLLWIDAITL